MRWTEVRASSAGYDEERVVLGAVGGVGECVRHLLASSGCGRFVKKRLGGRSLRGSAGRG